MIGLKIHKRSVVVNNLLMFIVLSVIFVHVMESFAMGVSAIRRESASSFFLHHFWLMSLMFVTLLSVIKVANFSKYIVGLFFSVVTYYSLNSFFINYDKMVLTYIFVYVAIAGYFFMFWQSELEEAAYRPKYTKYHIGKKSLLNIHVKLLKHDSTFEGLLTNADMGTCFVNLLQNEHLVGKVTLQITFDGFSFVQPAEIVTSYFDGVGMRFLHNTQRNDDYNWNDFYTVLRDRGLLART